MVTDGGHSSVNRSAIEQQWHLRGAAFPTRAASTRRVPSARQWSGALDFTPNEYFQRPSALPALPLRQVWPGIQFSGAWTHSQNMESGWFPSGGSSRFLLSTLPAETRGHPASVQAPFSSVQPPPLPLLDQPHLSADGLDGSTADPGGEAVRGATHAEKVSLPFAAGCSWAGRRPGSRCAKVARQAPGNYHELPALARLLVAHSRAHCARSANRK